MPEKKLTATVCPYCGSMNTSEFEEPNGDDAGQDVTATWECNDCHRSYIVEYEIVNIRATMVLAHLPL
jgi:transposase-like protein